MNSDANTAFFTPAPLCSPPLRRDWSPGQIKIYMDHFDGSGSVHSDRRGEHRDAETSGKHHNASEEPIRHAFSRVLFRIWDHGDIVTLPIRYLRTEFWSIAF